ncbi:MAG: stage V sporulation protein E [Parcubacteria group bacterium CG10_big_fil_rev_8_21_14_0_10_38_31]|nr:MAG: stage V sporulation protein E [Parcubacteria group bacterium CG10_big_fil_rev_8_21_14_0_10_38_31]
MTRKKYDKIFLASFLFLVLGGFLIFSSSAMGLISRDGASFYKILIKQFIVGFIVGGGSLLLAYKIDYRNWKRFAVFIFVFSFFLSLLVFVPQLGFKHGGAKRWIDLGFTSFQPSEFLKLGFIIYLSSWLSNHKKEITSIKSGLLPFLLMVVAVGLLLISEPDIGTLLVIIISSVAIFYIGGAGIKQVILFFSVGLASFAGLVFAKPYLMNRMLVYLGISSDIQGIGYQLKQSLIAIGSGGLYGRGFGMSIQKFKYLPEPIGDSIFSVTAEEFGFLGSVILIGGFLFFLYRGLLIASRAPDVFGKLLAVGIIILIVGQSFVNIGAMIGILPLTGLPLIFISQGSSAFIFAMIEVGILLNISKHSSH